MRILVPIEDPIFAAVLVQFICGHKWLENTELHLIHVVEPFLLQRSPNAALSRLMSQSERHLINAARTMLESVAAEISKRLKLLNVSCEVRIGSVLAEILAAARAQKTDLIIAGSHGRSGFNRMILGSVSLALVTESECPVLLVKPPEAIIKKWEACPPNALAEAKLTDFLGVNGIEDHAKRILVCLDEKEMSNKLLSFLVKHKWAHSARFKLLSVVQPIKWANLISVEDLETLQSECFQHNRELLNVLATKLLDFADKGAVETVLLEADAKAGILQVARDWKADIIVLGSGSSAAWHKDKKKIGSVALSVMSKAPCAVLFLQDHYNPQMHRYVAATAARLT